MTRLPAVYMLAAVRNGTLYTGVTSHLVQRTWQHREHLIDGFSEKYGVTRPVWFEMHETMESAITREKRIKAWKRGWKLRLIEQRNPYWRDLWPEISERDQDTGFLPSQE